MLTVFGSVKPYRHRLDFSEFQCIVTHKMRSLPMEYNIALLFNLIDEEGEYSSVLKIAIHSKREKNFKIEVFKVCPHTVDGCRPRPVDYVWPHLYTHE
jgi:hypothetical protein